ncbi:salicylate synthase [Micromonospora sp. CPCC 206061]|uniref:salicylate synthase n=1 Tax=Micromonospora sp. CPCC 206061 TaxID=3122410 RepID=UPI002FEF318D
MSSEGLVHYAESKVRLPGDPLAAVSRLAAGGLHEDYVVYENSGQWAFASGVLADVRLDRTGARLYGVNDMFLPWDGDPLRQVRRLLEAVQVDSWRAYGWAAFELAYAKEGDLTGVGDERLLHLVVPHTEVRVQYGWAHVRSADKQTLAAVLAALAQEPAGPTRSSRPVDVRREGAEDYQRAVKLAVEEIAAHRFQKVILSRVVPLAQEIDLVGTYVSGRRGNRPARSFLLNLDGVEMAGFSPEVVIHVDEDGRVVSQPLAGTRMLTDDRTENQRLRTELLSNAKEIYEHAISVKTACDELHTVCTPDSLSVQEFMVVRERGTVQHLASRVSGKLARGRHAWDAFGATFPAVTASGVPKAAAYASIRSHEGQARGLYSGAVLTVDASGAMDAALVLRAVYRRDGTTWLQAGAGIVEQSRPEREFEETCEKLDSVARYLVPADVSADRTSSVG